MFKTYQSFSKAATIIMAAIFVFIILSGCATLYKRVSQTPPLTTKDTFYLAERCATTFTVDTSGKIIYIQPSPDSSDYWKGQIANSIKIYTDTFTDVLTRYKDTCTSAKKIYQQGATNGYNTGYAVAKQESELKYQPILKKVDSTYRDALVKLNRYWVEKYSQANTGMEIAQQQAEKYRGKSENRGQLNMWLIIALALSVLGNVLQFKKPKIPSFIK